MGYGLPAAIGVCVGSGKKEVICVNGEGCMQMNLQELQTIRHHNLPIRIFVINNEGYHSIRQTQTAYFGGHLVGVGEESGDLSFPDLSRLAPAYGFAYKECRNSATLEEDLRAVMEVPAPVICQVLCRNSRKRSRNWHPDSFRMEPWCRHHWKICIRFFREKRWRRKAYYGKSDRDRSDQYDRRSAY